MQPLHDSVELTQALTKAKQLAAREGKAPHSVHLLAGLLASSNRATVLLAERGVDGAILRQAATQGREAVAETTDVVATLLARAGEVARNVAAGEVDCLHLLVAMTRLQQAAAHQVLGSCGQPLAQLRNAAIGRLTGTLPRRFLRVGTQQGAASRPTPAAPRQQTRTAVHQGPPPPVETRARPQRASRAEDAHKAVDTVVLSKQTQDAGRADAAAHVGVAKSQRDHKPVHHTHDTEPVHDTEHTHDADHTRDSGHAHGAEQAHDTEHVQTTETACDAAHAAPAHPSPNAQETHDTGEASRPLALAPPLDIAAAPLADIAPTLAECGVDLTARARAHALDRAIGRDRELESLADILGKRRANNPVLVGPPGVGKTAIVEGLAIAWSEIDPVDGLPYDGRRIVALDTGALVAGTSLRGSFAERMSAIKAEVAAADGHLVVFIDELHTLMGAGASGEGPQDAAGELKTALARGEFPCIGATTDDEFKRYIERDPALERRFSPIAVAEPSVEDAQAILRGALAPYQSHHRITYADDAVQAAALLTHRFVTERKLPDKAFAALDLAGSRARRRGKKVVEWADVAAVVHAWTEVPLERLIERDAQRFAHAERYLGERLVGHPHVVEAVAQALRRGFAGFNGKRPMGSFLFLGPTGVGKTEMVKILAEFVFGRRDAIVRFDMSELAEKHAVARLLGAQPGYVGYEDGGQLTEALRKRPFQIVLFDEVEKAHPDVLNVLLQLLDEGHLSDAQGRRISFANTLVVLTSNLGAEALERSSSIGFGPDASGQAAHDQERIAQVAEAARLSLTPELWARIDEPLVFLPLTYLQVEQIAHGQLDAQKQTLATVRGVRLSWGAQVVPFLLRQGGFDVNTGARGLRQAIARHVEAPIAAALLEGELQPYGGVHLEIRRGEAALRLRITPSSRPTPRGDGRSRAPSPTPPAPPLAFPNP